MMKKYLFIFAILLFPTWVHAIAVTGVSGTISNGETITITGTDFGANGPTVLIFDDFEGGTNGNVLQTDLAPLGSWYQVVQGTAGLNDENDTTNDDSIYSNANAVSGSLAARFTDIYNWSTYGDRPRIIARTSTAFDSFYLSYWALLPAGNTFPGDGYGGANWKTVWIMSADHGSTDADLTISGNGWGAWLLFGNDLPYGAGGWFQPSNTYTMEAGTWTRFQLFVLGKTDATGIAQVWITNTTYNTDQKLNHVNVATLNSGDTGKRREFHVNGYVRQTPDSSPTFDDVYIATGDYARARVEIGNASTYADCSNLTVVTPTSWGNTSIVGVLRQGSFTTGTVYIYVTDADGNQSAGYPISFGGDEVAPTILNVSSNKANGTYTVGEVIDIDVTFSEAVTSTGNITLTLETGDTDRECSAFSVTASTTASCNYTVVEGDASNDLEVKSISGTINDLATPVNAMSNFTPATNLAANKAIVIDTTAPAVTEFVIPATSSSLQVTTTTFTCTGSPTGYIATESAEAPALNADGWTASSPVTYTFDSTGEKTLYGWCKDVVNVSTSVSDTVTVSSGIFKAPFIIAP